jgi:hypothetical protein
LVGSTKIKKGFFKEAKKQNDFVTGCFFPGIERHDKSINVSITPTE